MRVLVTGGRAFSNAVEVHRILFTIHDVLGITALGHGDADGLDTLAKLWALSIPTIDVKGYPVEQRDWDVYGGRAGNMRNSQMLRQFVPDIGVSFPGGNGTADMTEKLINAGVPTFFGRWNSHKDKLTWKVVNG